MIKKEEDRAWLSV